MKRPISYEQTMLVTATFGTGRILTPASFKEERTLFNPSSKDSSFLIPVKTTLPEEKISDAIRGSSIR